MNPEMTNLRGKARLLKPAMHHWHQIATSENAKNQANHIQGNPFNFHRTSLLVTCFLQGRPR